MTWQDKLSTSINYADKNYNAEQVTRWLDGAADCLQKTWWLPVMVFMTARQRGISCAARVVNVYDLAR